VLTRRAAGHGHAAVAARSHAPAEQAITDTT
jgi:hypothetical protein